ncbi:hypothetical protein HDE80_004072 [Rhodanobacter sp. A1T4]|nr:hypothetical protein [Rhodanobacter sp. A1T4]
MHLMRSMAYTRYKLTGKTTEQDVLAAAEGSRHEDEAPHTWLRPPHAGEVALAANS